MTKPTPLTPDFGNFPALLTKLPNWVLWCYTLKEGKYTKVPKQPNGPNASTTNPATWCSFDAARAAYARGWFDGLGIVLTGKPLDEGLYLIGMDFDHCLSAGVLDEAPQQAIDRLNTYAEISPSGEGVRLFLLHDKAIPARKTNVNGKSREVYASGRYLTVTGHCIGQPKEVRHVV